MYAKSINRVSKLSFIGENFKNMVNQYLNEGFLSCEFHKLFITTSKMLMGVSVPEIAVIIFLRPFNMLHYILQGGGRGGRRTGSNDGLRQKVIVYILWNKSDVANNVQGINKGLNTK